MKKLFGHKGPKGGKASGSRDFSEEGGLKPPPATPLYQKLATHGNHVGPASNQGTASVEDERWEVIPPLSAPDPALLPNPYPPTVTALLPNPHTPTINTPSRTSSFSSVNPSIPPGAGVSPAAQMPMLVGAPAQSPLPPPRSASPMSTATNMSSSTKLIKNRDRERDAYMQAQAATQGAGRKKAPPPTAPVALGILRALDPPNGASALMTRSLSEEQDRRTVSESGHAPYRDHRMEREQPPPPVEKDGKDIGRKDDKKRGFWGSRDKDKDRDKEKEKALDREREKERERVRERERELQLHARDVMQRDPVKERMPYDERGREPGFVRELRREEDGQAELTRMIGYLTATASEDWTLVLDVCDRASASEASAREAVRALRREFKYGEPAAQLSAARLWAIMLRNSSDIFVTQSTSRKFLDTLEDLLSSSRTSPVVRERLLEVVAAAAYASGHKKGNERDGFKGLWKRVKPFDKPDEGVPFDTDDAMFHPPTSASTRLSGYENMNIPIVAYQEPTPTGLESAPLTPAAPNPIKSKRRSPSDRTENSTTTRNRIIPPEEDMRRLFQECKIGQGNASVLAQALVAARPEDLKKEGIIKEFYPKCRASQEIIFAQIPWASAGAERAIARKPEKPPKDKSHTRKRTMSNSKEPSAKLKKDRSNSSEEEDGTMEEKLLAALLGANAELQEALRQYEDLERVAMERKAEDRSRKEVRMDARQRERLAAELDLSVSSATQGDRRAGSSSRTPSPPSRSHSPHQTPQQPNHAYPSQNQTAQNPTLAHPRPKHLALSDSELDPNYLLAAGVGGQNLNPNLAPPPAAPHGPRSPAQVSVHSHSNSQGHHSRASSPGTASLVEPYAYAYTNGHGGGQGQWHGGGQSQGQGQRYGSGHGHGHGNEFDDVYGEDGDGYEFDAPPKPSAKALGKRKIVEPDTPSGPQFDANDMYSSSNLNRPSSFAPAPDHDPEFDDDDNHAWHHPPVQFVYDAVAERTKQWHEGAQKEIVGGAGANGAH